MKRVLMSIALTCSLSMAGAALAGVAGSGSRDCNELRQEIALKIEANGVRSYSLQNVEPDAPSAGRVVGQCAGGSRHIVYRRLALGDAALMALLVPPEAEREYVSESSAQSGL